MMENREKQPKQELDDIRFTHIAILTSFYINYAPHTGRQPPVHHVTNDGIFNNV